MDKEEFKAVLSSLARIELLIKTIMAEKYGEKVANEVYSKAVNIVDENLFKEGNND